MRGVDRLEVEPEEIIRSEKSEFLLLFASFEDRIGKLLEVTFADEKIS